MFENEIKVLKALANGVNYFTGEKSANDSILNDVDIVRTLYQICDKLENLKPEKVQKTDFICPTDIEERFEFEDELNLSKIIEKIANLYPEMKKIKHTQITDMLIEQNLLERILDSNGKNRTLAKDNARDYGIYNVTKYSIYGRPYNVITYNKNGQKYILSLLKNLWLNLD